MKHTRKRLCLKLIQHTKFEKMRNYNNVYPILLAEFAKIIFPALAALEYIIFSSIPLNSFCWASLRNISNFLKMVKKMSPSCQSAFKERVAAQEIELICCAERASTILKKFCAIVIHKEDVERAFSLLPIDRQTAKSFRCQIHQHFMHFFVRLVCAPFIWSLF